MNRLSKDELKTLQGRVCISIFPHGLRTRSENRRYRIRLRYHLGFTLPPGKMPDAADLAGTFRY